MRGWSVAQSPILLTTVTLERLRKRGYEPLLDYYSKVSSNLMKRCIRDRICSGVRGAPYRLQPVMQSTRLHLYHIVQLCIVNISKTWFSHTLTDSILSVNYIQFFVNRNQS